MEQKLNTVNSYQVFIGKICDNVETILNWQITILQLILTKLGALIKL